MDVDYGRSVSRWDLVSRSRNLTINHFHWVTQIHRLRDERRGNYCENVSTQSFRNKKLTGKLPKRIKSRHITLVWPFVFSHEINWDNWHEDITKRDIIPAITLSWRVHPTVQPTDHEMDEDRLEEWPSYCSLNTIKPKIWLSTSGCLGEVCRLFHDVLSQQWTDSDVCNTLPVLDSLGIQSTNCLDKSIVCVSCYLVGQDNTCELIRGIMNM